MTCQYDRGMLSRYLDNELFAPDRQAVEAHLEECSDCRSLVEQYRDGAGAIQRYLQAVPATAALRRPAVPVSQRWAVAAIAACVLLATVTVGVATETGSRLVDLVTNVSVRLLSPEDSQAFEERQTSGAERPPSPFSAFKSIDEAEEAAGFRLPRPDFIPEGYYLEEARVSQLSGADSLHVSITYRQGMSPTRLEVILVRTSARMIIQAPAEATETVLVSGQEAQLINGLWMQRPGEETQFYPEGGRRLIFTWDGGPAEVKSVTAMGSGLPILPAEELIRVAESFR